MREICLIQSTVLGCEVEVTYLTQYLDLINNVDFIMIDYSSLTFHLLESCIFGYVLVTIPCHQKLQVISSCVAQRNCLPSV